MNSTFFSDDEHIHVYEFSGLKGRYGHWPALNAEAKRTFVLVYGQHATIERMLPVINALQNFGDVYIADNPGFGGMDSAYDIGRYPDLKFYAEHLEHFIKNNVQPDRKLTLLGISYGFQMLVELVNTYPQIEKRTEELISFVGFVSHNNFKMSKKLEIPLMYGLCNLGRTKFGAKFSDIFFYSEAVIRFGYWLSTPINPQYRSLPGNEKRNYAKQQAWLWIVNDTLTHGVTAWDFFKKNDLTNYRLPTSTVLVGVPNDHLLSSESIKQDMDKIFKNFKVYNLNLKSHAPLDIESPHQVLHILPSELKKEFKKSKNNQAAAA